MASDERTCSSSNFLEEEECQSVSFKTRRKILVVLAIVGCSAVFVLGIQDIQDLAVSELDDYALTFDQDLHSRASPVILEQQSSALETALRRLKKNKGKKYCDHAVSFSIKL